ncbi:spore germination protein [Paenibacillus curdlanolyticus YK9]|uniref:Spore germination protein n=1 Tax=Paenibacillus curdlanolyticus YK9 TaxID=717606 RepID=E0ICN0_9BACL|nr:spore germination protein GerPE [Paenibacillus curdlanolyticus]EFM09916.1 spore germination protein [Paenibacillus curdlanolyticus YK9]
MPVIFLNIELPEPTFPAPECCPDRTYEVGGIDINTISQAGVLQIGDRVESTAMLRGLAVQRQEDHPYAGDVFFESYTIFDRSIPVIVDANDDDSIVEMERFNACPLLSVGCITITSAGAASQIVVGCQKSHRAESRIKHIRQFAGRRPLPPACP